jgi:hypothetical protein
MKVACPATAALLCSANDVASAPNRAANRLTIGKPFAFKYTDMAVVPHTLCKSGFPLCLLHGADDGQHQSARRGARVQGIACWTSTGPQVDLLGFQPGATIASRSCRLQVPAR